MTSDTTTDGIVEAKDLLSSMGNDSLAESLGEELDDRAEAAERVVRMKELAARAEEAGLADDPAVQALRDRAEALQTDADLGPDPTHPERLAEEYGLDEEAVADLPEDVREDLERDLSAVDELETSRSELAKRELRRRRDKLGDTLDAAGVEAAELVAENAPAPTAELSAALAAPADDVNDSGSERLRAARLRDRVDELNDDLADAESTLLKITLRDRKADLEERLADLEEA
jgi:hypothetical protein